MLVHISVYLKYFGNFNVPDMRTLEKIEAERTTDEAIDGKAENATYEKAVA